MTTEDLVKLNRQIEECLEKNADLLGRDTSQLLAKHGIGRSLDLSHALAQLAMEGRLLQIGVIGRVKAGKSSLLNALVFDGESILPKAATPMTAALTTLTHGDDFRAQVQFYTPADLEDIRDKAKRYGEKLDHERERAAEALRQRQQRTGRVNEDEEFWSQVERDAMRGMRTDSSLDAAQDQYKRIRKARVSAKTLAGLESIQADSIDQLAEKLGEFVGADGRYMAMTKSVDIFLPLDSLRGIRIIDTPGLNDPVQSREERTTTLLSQCDVVFIVSPAGQFLSEQDLEVMGRITQKEGIQELVVIASQVDNLLHSEDIRRAAPRMALDVINRDLGEHMISTLTRLRTTQPEVGTTFDGLIERGATRVLHTSGISHSLACKLDQTQRWDSTERKAWDNLRHSYGEFFDLDAPERTRANLELLANTAALHTLVAEVRTRKISIVEQRNSNLIAAKADALASLRNDLVELARRKRQEINSGDIGSLRKQSQHLSSKSVVVEHDMDTSLQEWKRRYRKTLRTKLKKALEGAYAPASGSIDFHGDEKIKVEWDKPGAGSWLARHLWGGGVEKETQTIRSLYPARIRSSIREFIRTIQNGLQTETDEIMSTFNNELNGLLVESARKSLGDDVDPAMVIRSILSIVAGFPHPSFALDEKAVRRLSNAPLLKGQEAKDLIDSAVECLEDLKEQASDQIDTYIHDLVDSIPESISDAFVGDMHARIEQLEQQILSRQLTTERLDRMIQELEQA